MSNGIYNELMKHTPDFDECVVKAYKDLEVNKAQSKEIDFIVKELSKLLLWRDNVQDDDKFDGYTVAEYMKGAMVVALASKDSIMDAVASIKDKDEEDKLDVEEVIEDVN